MIIIPIVIGALGTVTKGLLKRLEDFEAGGGVETIQSIVLLRTARILIFLPNSSEKPSANADVKNPQGVNNNNNNNIFNPVTEYVTSLYYITISK